MKLVVSIVHKDDAEGLVSALIGGGFRTTTLSTTGAFLREGNATIMAGVEEHSVPQVLEIVKANTHERTERPPRGLLRLLAPQTELVRISAATVFVLDLADLARF